LQFLLVSESYNTDRVWNSLQSVGLVDKISALPYNLKEYIYKNFDTKGVDLSGGEEQKLAITRAFYKDSPFVILDEPTAALDPISEYEIYSKFNEITSEKAALYISHRLSSCRFCDRIAVFDGGKIIQ
jgi:ATP-binding cassette subfamily B protein